MVLSILIIQCPGEHAENKDFRESLTLQRAFARANHQCDVQHPDMPVASHKYDIIICCENTYLDRLPNLKENSALKLFWIIDAHCGREDKYLTAVQDYDIVLHSCQSLISYWEKKLPHQKHWWFPNAYDDILYSQLALSPQPKATPVLFLGNTNNRTHFLEMLAQKVGLKVKKALGVKMCQKIMNAKIHVNQNIALTDINYRHFETLGLGTCLVCERRPELYQLGFKDGVNCIMYSDVNECVDKIKKSLESESWKAITQAGKELAKKNTYYHRVVNLISLIQRLQLIAPPKKEIVNQEDYEILIKFPTRSRPEKFWETLNYYIKMAKKPEKISFLISCDDDDETMNNPEMKAKLQSIPRLQVFYGNSKNKIEAVNVDMPIQVKEDIILLASDDMIPQIKGYDEIIRQDMRKYYPDTDGILWYYDGYQKRINTLTIMGKKYYSRFNYLYFPGYQTAYCDDELTIRGNVLKKQKFIDVCIIKHENFYWTGEGKDELLSKYEEDRYTKADKKLFMTRMQVGFI